MKKLILLFLYGIPITGITQPAPVASNAFHWAELPVSRSTGREGRRIMEGTLPGFAYIEMHATTQQKGAVPRPPHAQKDLEEVIIVTDGKMKFTIGRESRVLGKGSVVLVPPGEMQSVENTGDGPLTYYVLMLRSEKPVNMERSDKAGGALFLNADSLSYVPSARGGGIKYFDRPTAMCENFEMHITHLEKKGPSHAPHTHADTEIILILEGETEMTINNKKYTAAAGDLYIAVSGEMHGIGNASDKPCRYFAFKWR